MENFEPSKILPLIGVILVSLTLFTLANTYLKYPGILAMFGLVILLFISNINQMAPKSFVVEINDILVGTSMFFIITYFQQYMPSNIYIVGGIGLALIIFGR